MYQSWNGMMHELAAQPPLCHTNCQEPVVVYIFFVSFIVVSSFLVINIFVAVVLMKFESEFSAIFSKSVRVTRSDLDGFTQIWGRYIRYPTRDLVGENTLHLILSGVEEDEDLCGPLSRVYIYIYTSYGY